MPTHSNSVPVITTRKKRWLPLLAVALFASAALVFLTTPRLVCLLLQMRAPLLTRAVLITGAQFGGDPSPAMVVATCSPYDFRQIAEGASGYWLAPILFSEDQHVWGVFNYPSNYPSHITWRIDLNATRKPTVFARIPISVAQKILEDQIRENGLPFNQANLQYLSIRGEAITPTKMDWTIHCKIDAIFSAGNTRISVNIKGFSTHIETQLLKRPDGTQYPSVRLHIYELFGEEPLSKNLSMLMPFIEERINHHLEQVLSKVVVPNWWPPVITSDLSTIPNAVTEF